jgi:hypothetical protein
VRDGDVALDAVAVPSSAMAFTGFRVPICVDPSADSAKSLSGPSAMSTPRQRWPLALISGTCA